MPKGRGSNERRRNDRQKRAVWLNKHGSSLQFELAHHFRMKKATQGRGVKGPFCTAKSPLYPHSDKVQLAGYADPVT